MRIRIVVLGIAAVIAATNVAAAADAQQDPNKLMTADTLAGLAWRCIGPALSSGRVGDFAVNPDNRAHYFVAVASGGVWKTTNSGASWTPVFDAQGSYSIGCLAMDPRNPNVVWVGTGENNSQRSVGFGDGVYRTLDGGTTWQNLGLKDSEHIGMIRIDPRDSNVVYVAAQGPLWRSGGERGLYKTTDGGVTWSRILHVSEDTGINEVHFDPRNPDVLYASAYQRRRHVWTLINGGPESAIYKSVDAGATWRKITQGIPEVDKGRIGLGVSPAAPDIVYAIVEAQDEEGGVFRSTDRGETWEKRSDYMCTSPQYYNELVCDPVDPERVYFLDTFLHVTEDGGKTVQRAPGKHRHVDDHALWIDPADTNYLLIGCDGGVYESFDRGEHWIFKSNLPITQFYRVTVDNSSPFYHVYGGTQDNNTLGGPSRTLSPAGIVNEDWIVTVGGDGYETVVDPNDPNIIYSQWQYGGLVRYDRRNGEVADIKPREAPGDDPHRWNWDSPLIMSPHSHTRLYFACQRLFRTDDRGNSWTPVSGDLTRQIDRNALKVMGRVQPPDAVAKHDSTSYYGNIVSLTESPLVEGLIYVGTDDGLVQVTEDGGENWRKIGLFPAVPDMTYVSCLVASRHDRDTVYATFDNHKNGDFKPYVLVSTDRGANWEPIQGDLPSRDTVYTIAEDTELPDLLFVGTEFGVYFTNDRGAHWLRLKGGLPTIAVRDIDVQRRENDLAIATFGRGFYILDDYTPLRTMREETLTAGPTLFPVKDAPWYVETSRLGNSSGRGWQGAAYYAAPNPPFGAVFTYFLNEKLMTRKEQRREAEKKAEKIGQTTTYPAIEDFRAEDEATDPMIVLLVRDSAGNLVRRVTGPREKGIHRIAWDLRYPSAVPTSLDEPKERDPWDQPPLGPLVMPGTYSVTLAKKVDGTITPLTDPQSFDVVPLNLGTFGAEDRAAVTEFRRKVQRLQRAVRGAAKSADEAQTRLAHLRKAILDTPAADVVLLAEIDALRARLNKLTLALTGDDTRARRNEPAPPSILERVEYIAGDQWYVTSEPTQTQHDAYRYAGEAFAPVLAELRKLIDEDLTALEAKLEAAGAPWTPGRVPTWELE